MKPENEVIEEFNDLVNVTADELEAWLKSDDARSAGWPKDDAEGDGETVGHDSGRKIVDILRSNPDKDPEKYTDDQVAHMRKVVSYNKRHIAQESGTNSEKSNEEVKQTKSYASLLNWGHDILRSMGREDGDDRKKGGEKKEKKQNGKEGNDEEEEEEEEKGGEEEDGEEAQAGDKRKKSAGAGQNGASKKRQTRQGKGTSAKDEEEDDEEDGDYEENEDEDGEEEEEDDDAQPEGDELGGEAKAKKGPKPGDKVSWNWGGGQPEGKVLDVKGDKAEVTTKRGNKVSRHGHPEDPAVVLDTGKSKAVKANHELN